MELFECWVYFSCWRVVVVSASMCPGCVCCCFSKTAHLEASPSLCPQFHRGQIDFDSVRTDRQTDSARRCDRTGTSLPLNQPLPLPASLPPAYGNKLSLSQSMQGRGLGLYHPPISPLPPLIPPLCCLTGQSPAPGHW